METTAFAPLGLLHIPSPSKLFPSACCPDKDLVAIVSRLGGQHTLSLWNYNHGSRIWEVGVDSTDGNTGEIVGLVWSPDGRSIAVIHDPPRVTLHSLQDGCRVLTLPLSGSSNSEVSRISGVWWFQDEKSQERSSVPDIFKRKDVITGTAHAILKNLPLLDSLQDDSQKLSATDLFAFQGSQIKSMSKSLYPDVIDQWPTLSVDPVVASIGSTLVGGSLENHRGYWDAMQDGNNNSILAVADELGYFHCYLDGSFPLGAIPLGPGLSVTASIKDPKRSTFFLYLRTTETDVRDAVTFLPPTVVDIPLLNKRQPRDLANLSSAARALMSYLLRVVQEMKSIWIGTDAIGGARHLGSKWVQALEARQREQFEQEPNAILDLTTLLVTGRATDALLDFLGSGEYMSERGIQKWETTMTEALTKLRDLSEKRVIPACQRLHLVLEELQGWSQLSQYSIFELSLRDICDCLEILSRTILLTAWLAAAARKHLSRFREFISWLRFETLAANPPNDNPPQPRHDILEVNNYLTSGLLDSPIDNCFMGPIPCFSVRDLGTPERGDSVLTVLKRVRGTLSHPHEMGRTDDVKEPKIEQIDRNIDALMHELAARCKIVFARAAGAACRSAVTSSSQHTTSSLSNIKLTSEVIPSMSRERTIMPHEGHELLQYVALPLPSEASNFLCIARVRFNQASEPPCEVAVVLLERIISDEWEQVFDLLDADFFDDECIVIIYRLRTSDKTTYIATLTYDNLEYQLLQADECARMTTRQELLSRATECWKDGNLRSVRHPIKRYRALAGCKEGEVSVAVNGRAGRRVACVLDIKGTLLECFDMEGGDMESDDGGGRDGVHISE